VTLAAPSARPVLLVVNCGSSSVKYQLEGLGIALDPDANARPVDRWAEVGNAGSAVRLLVVRTNEELQIARETLAVIRDVAGGAVAQ
jgi:acetate kinase